MEASTLQAPAGLARHRIAIGIPLLRLRSDEQLVALFRAGHDEAFRVIHDRYEKRLLAYTRQMLSRGPDAEDALQDVFERAYSGLRSSQRELALRAWLFRVAHNRCIDELRRPLPPAPEVLQLTSRAVQDPVAEVEGRESLRRLIIDVRRLPGQQRSALLMREMGGMSYAELAGSLGTSVPAVKSLLVRARLALAQAAAARDTACSDIREELAGAHDRGVRPNATAKRHMRDCAGCRSFRRELRAVNRRLAALAPLGPFALAAKAFGFSGGASASSGATAGGAGGATASGGAAAFSGAASGGGALASSAVVVGSGHVATLLAAAVATAGGAAAISAPPAPTGQVRPVANVQSAGPGELQATGAGVAYQAAGVQDGAATAVGVSLVVQTNAKSASQAVSGGGPKRAAHAMAPSSASTSATTPPMIADSSSGIAPPPTDPASSLGVTLNGGSDPSSTGTTSTDTGSTTGSSGSGTGSGGSAGTSTGTGTQSSGSPSSGSTGTSGSGSSTGTSGSGSGTTSSTTSTGTSPDAGSGTKPSSSGSGTSTSSK